MSVAPPPPPLPARPPGSRYGWLVGVAFLLLITYVIVNGARSQGPGSVGIPAGRGLPVFAVPLALARLEGDANVAQQGVSGAAGRVPACRLRRPDVLNSCALAERGPVVLAFFAQPNRRCRDQLDAMQRIQARFPGVGFAAVAVRGKRPALRAAVRRQRWSFPVGHDRDGAVANLYGISVCPTTTLALPGGRVQRTLLGLQDDRALSSAVAGLRRGAQAAGWRPPR